MNKNNIRDKILNNLNNLFSLTDKNILKANKDELKNNIDYLKKSYIETKKYFYVLSGLKSDENFKDKVKVFTKDFGTIIVQNKKKEKFVHVTPKVSAIKKFNVSEKKKFLRYHETNSGGALHSDGPQLNTPPKYIFLACITNSTKGGDSIITDCKKIHADMKKNDPEAFNILSENFLFERRGFDYANQNIFSKPIFFQNKKSFQFRYLRVYIEAAYKTKNLTLSKSKKNALDTLDNYLNNEDYQMKLKLVPGDILIVNNNYLAHGRTGFSLNKNTGQRDYLRVWVN